MQATLMYAYSILARANMGEEYRSHEADLPNKSILTSVKANRQDYLSKVVASMPNHLYGVHHCCIRVPGGLSSLIMKKQKHLSRDLITGKY